MLDLYDKIQEAVAFIRSQWDTHPKAGIILGTGLGSLVENIDDAVERRDPSTIDVRRKQRIAAGAGVQLKVVGELLKNFDMMKNVMTGMAGMGASDKMAEMQKLQAGAMNPAALGKTKKPTGKRLTAKELKKRKKEREKQLKAMRKNKNKPGDASA